MTKTLRADALRRLSPRQRQVFDLVEQGLYRKEVADKLKISQNTVKKHVKAILRHAGGADTMRRAIWLLYQRQAATATP